MTHFPYLSDDEMGNLRWVAESYSNELPVYVPDSGRLLKGDRVRITSGYFAGNGGGGGDPAGWRS